MRKQIELPSGNLGQLGFVNIDLEMKAKHFDQLTLTTKDNFDTTVVNILNDLMDEDANKLTRIDMVYLFTLVKCVSNGGKYSVETVCPFAIKNQKGEFRKCSSTNKIDVEVGEADCIKQSNEKYHDTVELNFDGEIKTFELRIPTVVEEQQVREYFLADKNYSLEEITGGDDKKTLEFLKRRSVYHIKNDVGYTIEQLVSALENSKYQTVMQLLRTAVKYNKLGLKHKEYKITCKECGGTYDYHLPLYSGLSV